MPTHNKKMMLVINNIHRTVSSLSLSLRNCLYFSSTYGSNLHSSQQWQHHHTGKPAEFTHTRLIRNAWSMLYALFIEYEEQLNPKTLMVTANDIGQW